MACSRPSGALEIVKTLLKSSGKDAKLATDKVNEILKKVWYRGVQLDYQPVLENEPTLTPLEREDCTRLSGGNRAYNREI